MHRAGVSKIFPGKISFPNSSTVPRIALALRRFDAECPPRVRKNLSIAGLVFAWLCANGALLDVVQVVAWTKMFAGYSETMPLGAALSATFDPAKPCELCVGVAQAKDVAQKQLPPLPEQAASKLVLACEFPSALLFPARTERWPATLAGAAPSRCETVPVPPPRA